MLNETLQRLVNEKLTAVQELADTSGVAPSTVYRWMSGESEPDFRAVRAMLRELSSIEAQRAILAAFTAGSLWQGVHVEEDLDVNRDGRIDANDALDASIDVVQAAGESLHQVREGFKNGRISEEQSSQVIAQLNEVVRACTIIQQVLIRVATARGKAKS